MAFEHKNMTGSIFINTDKTNERQPDWKGKIKINDEEYYASGWTNEGRNGDYISMKFESVAESEARRGRAAPRPAARTEILDRNRALVEDAQRRAREMGKPRPSFDSDIPADDDIPF